MRVLKNKKQTNKKTFQPAKDLVYDIKSKLTNQSGYYNFHHSLTIFALLSDVILSGLIHVPDFIQILFTLLPELPQLGHIVMLLLKQHLLACQLLLKAVQVDAQLLSVLQLILDGFFELAALQGHPFLDLSEMAFESLLESSHERLYSDSKKCE